jgi:type I restriction enzyme M protein
MEQWHQTARYLLRKEPKEGAEEASWHELRNIPRRTEDLATVDTPITRRELEPTTDFLSLVKRNVWVLSVFWT